MNKPKQTIIQLKQIVNTVRELTEYNGCYNPKRYNNYLPKKEKHSTVKL